MEKEDPFPDLLYSTVQLQNKSIKMDLDLDLSCIMAVAYHLMPDDVDKTTFKFE